MDESTCKKKANKLKRDHRRRKKQKSSQNVKIGQFSKIKKIKADDNLPKSFNQPFDSSLKCHSSEGGIIKLGQLLVHKRVVYDQRRHSHLCFVCHKKFANTDLYRNHGSECEKNISALN